MTESQERERRERPRERQRKTKKERVSGTQTFNEGNILSGKIVVDKICSRQNDCGLMKGRKSK